jgi:heme-degrading monooxygenase HmoA
MKKIADQYPGETMILMLSPGTAQLWHETNGRTVFKSPRKYEVIHASGTLSKNGFVACNHIPVRDEGRPVFEYDFTKRLQSVEQFPGFIALRVLRPLSSDTYVAMTMWNDEESYNRWKGSESFKKSHQSTGLKSAENTGVFAGPSYVSTFVAGEEDPDESSRA